MSTFLAPFIHLLAPHILLHVFSVLLTLLSKHIRAQHAHRAPGPQKASMGPPSLGTGGPASQSINLSVTARDSTKARGHGHRWGHQTGQYTLKLRKKIKQQETHTDQKKSLPRAPTTTFYQTHATEFRQYTHQYQITRGVKYCAPKNDVCSLYLCTCKFWYVELGGLSPWPFAFAAMIPTLHK